MGRDNLRIWRAPRAVLVIVALFCTVPATHAEELSSLRTYLRQTWQTAEGLPQNSVRSIAQTREGYLWFATAEGLVRFDGVRFTVFDRTSTPALPSGNIDSLAVAADGALWIGFRMNGIGRLHAGQVTLWTKDQGLSTNETSALAIAPDGSIWAATNSGLNRIRDGKVTVYRREQGLPDDHCYAIAVSARGVLVGTGAGAALVTDGGIERIAQADGAADADAASSMVTAVLEAGAGDWWLGTTKGLLRIRNGGAREWFTMADGLPSDDVTALTRGRDLGRPAIGRHGAVCGAVFDRREGPAIRHLHRRGRSAGRLRPHRLRRSREEPVGGDQRGRREPAASHAVPHDLQA
jgi:ligand-binding sensor domain-containing protein